MEGLTDCIDTWSSKHGVDESVLTEWKQKAIIKIDKKINIVSNNNTSVKYYKNVFQQKEPLNNLNNIHSEFVVV